MCDGDGGIVNLDFNSDETRACTGSLNGVVRAYDIRNMLAWENMRILVRKSEADGAASIGTQFANDDKWIVSAHLKGRV